MNVLGIETSCDETAAAVVKGGRTVLSNVVSSQIDLHAKYGGVIPEVAARSHLEVINPIINQALAEANLTWGEIDAIAVASGPGLIGSLMIGTLVARTLAIIKGKPLYSVHHILGHFYANFLGKKPPKFPCLTLVVSGGHTQLMLFRSHSVYAIIGQTQDDAVGEAFDKVAKIIGLPYPGGPAISRVAKQGDSKRFKFTKPRLSEPYDFSFSGIKTAVLRTAQELVGKDYAFPSHQIAPLLSKQDQADLAASFQATAVEILLDKTIVANEKFTPESICLAGGVAANQLLRQRFSEAFGARLTYPEMRYCTDNATMIATAGYFISQYSEPVNPFTLEPHPQRGLF
ncbi:MAG: tRNA (adenosine(37)-N6)-threonylcarbamoyltransferase complex transferase subunit TsaD [Candidatus Nanosyncoccaceae bacterium]|jgi:N6-L-threonylcarbamoyladenine synthase